jgi:hypothetical protein
MDLADFSGFGGEILSLDKAFLNEGVKEIVSLA